jgi:N-succinyldiaminopimelate aminotransferase
MSRFLLYRTYHGSAMAVPTQLASIAAWDDDEHAAANRRLYQEKFDEVIPILSGTLKVERPEGGFYLWAEVGGDDERFTRDLFATQNITVLPGSYLARTAGGINPGAGRVRISLVPNVAQCVEAARRLRSKLARLRGLVAGPAP